MEDTLHIHRFSARHRVHGADGQRRALAAQQTLLDGELEAALSRLGTGDEIVLIQRLQARVRLGARHADADNARRWSDALAASLTHALHHAGPGELQRFAGRPQALRAFAADMLNGHTARDWAWQRLALLPTTLSHHNTPGQRHAALLRLLANAPEEGVPLLRSLLHSALWPRLIGTLTEGELRGLAQSVYTRLAGIGAQNFGAELDPGAAASQPAVGAADAADAANAAESASANPKLPGWAAATPQATLTPQRSLWALRLGCMLDAPTLARRGSAAVDARLRTWAVHAPLHVDEASAAAASPAQSAAPKAAAAGQTPTKARGQDLRVDESLTSVASESVADADTAPAPATGHTEHGGLLLLAPLLPTSGALALLDDITVWPADSLPQALHALALRLWPMSPGDAAALALCGLPPSAPPPLSPPWTAAQETALGGARQRLLQHLAQRLPEDTDNIAPRRADAAAARALARVLPRRARITADPGWIDVHFSLRDVSTELRRAALDLDPGFLPWLGVVLRIRYE